MHGRRHLVRLRTIELLVLSLGMITALFILGLNAPGAFRANMAGGDVVSGFLLTCISFLIMGAVVSAPFGLLVYLGKKLVRDEKADVYQMAGFVVSCLVTGVSLYLYIDAHFIVERDRSSTAGLIFVAIPVYLCAAGGILYGILVKLQSHAKKKK